MNPYKLLNAIRHLPNFLSLLWRLFRDSRVPISPKLLLIGAILYVLSPYDLLPDFLIPVLGFAEDILILMLVLKYFVRVSPAEVVWEHVKRIEDEQRSGSKR
jgi:uncharacterized membrane protein YkvA (DUF1232 family)